MTKMSTGCIADGTTVVQGSWGQSCDGDWKFSISMVLLAIVVQLLAPIGAFGVVWLTHAVSDPLSMATICSGMTSLQDNSQTSPATPQHSANCCGFCGVSHGGVVAVDPPRRSLWSCNANTSASHGWKPRIRSRRCAPAGTRRRVRHPPFPDDLTTSHQDWCAPWSCQFVQLSEPAGAGVRVFFMFCIPPPVGVVRRVAGVGHDNRGYQPRPRPSDEVSHP